MEYKLFIFGTPELFARVQIPFDMNLSVGSVFIYNGKRYKILDIVRVAFEIEFNENGSRKYPGHDSAQTDKVRFEAMVLPEVYITEVPKY